MADDDERWMAHAVALARSHSADGAHGPFGAVLVRDGRCLAEGWNRVVELGDPSAHAEIMAIRAGGQALGSHVLSGCTLYASCEPCPMCLAACYWARLDRLVYASTAADAAAAGFDDARIRREVALPAERRVLPCRHLSLDEAAAVFAAWTANPLRRQY
jgi:guanine deaminase